MFPCPIGIEAGRRSCRWFISGLGTSPSGHSASRQHRRSAAEHDLGRLLPRQSGPGPSALLQPNLEYQNRGRSASCSTKFLIQDRHAHGSPTLAFLQMHDAGTDPVHVTFSMSVPRGASGCLGETRPFTARCRGSLKRPRCAGSVRATLRIMAEDLAWLVLEVYHEAMGTGNFLSGWEMVLIFENTWNRVLHVGISRNSDSRKRYSQHSPRRETRSSIPH